MGSFTEVCSRVLCQRQTPDDVLAGFSALAVVHPKNPWEEPEPQLPPPIAVPDDH